jgi:hypothetical protein
VRGRKFFRGRHVHHYTGDRAMDATRFDAMTKSWTLAPRRRVLGGLVGVSLATGLRLAGVREAEANRFGCRDVGAPCQRGRNCCSGRCRGPKGSKTCSAHHAGICLTSQDTCAQGANGNLCGTKDGGAGICSCFITTGGASFCSGTSVCTDCTGDRECEDSHGKGAACVVCKDCAVGNTACAKRCPNPD